MIPLAAIEKAAKEPKPLAWMADDARLTADKHKAKLWENGFGLATVPLFPDQSATILALCERIREPAKVKPLVWRPDGEDWIADTPFGPYLLAKVAGRYWLRFDGDAVGDRLPKYTLEQAQAFAQLLHDSRIRSALITETDNG